MRNWIAAALILVLGLSLTACGNDNAGTSANRWNDAAQQQANAAILDAGQVEERITRLQSLSADSVGLTQTYEALLAGDVLSVAFSAQGALRDSSFTHL